MSDVWPVGNRSPHKMIFWAACYPHWKNRTSKGDDIVRQRVTPSNKEKKRRSLKRIKT